MRLSIDSNVLIYSVDTHDRRAAQAYRIVTAAALADGMLTNQVLGEFLKVSRTKALISVARARQLVADWALLFPVLPTAIEHLLVASELAERYRLQYWDALILTVSKAARVEYLLTEDMGDGQDYDGVVVLNPFNPANAELIDLLLTPAPGTG